MGLYGRSRQETILEGLASFTDGVGEGEASKARGKGKREREVEN